jgi:hypothetical protein
MLNVQSDSLATTFVRAKVRGILMYYALRALGRRLFSSRFPRRGAHGPLTFDSGEMFATSPHVESDFPESHGVPLVGLKND